MHNKKITYGGIFSTGDYSDTGADDANAGSGSAWGFDPVDKPDGRETSTNTGILFGGGGLTGGGSQSVKDKVLDWISRGTAVLKNLAGNKNAQSNPPPASGSGTSPLLVGGLLVGGLAAVYFLFIKKKEARIGNPGRPRKTVNAGKRVRKKKPRGKWVVVPRRKRRKRYTVQRRKRYTVGSKRKSRKNK